MPRFVSDNPCSSRSLTLTPSGIAISSTGASGTVNTSASSSSLIRGQSVILNFSGGSAGGFVSNAEYYVIPGATSGSFQIASTKGNAINGVPLLTASGNAGAGTAYNVFPVGGTIYVGTGGNINMRGLSVEDTGLSSFCLHKNVPDGAVYPYMVGNICASGTSASDIIVWSD